MSNPKDQAGSSGAPAPVALVLSSDLLFGSRIRHALGVAGLEGRFLSSGREADDRLREGAAILIVDLGAASLEPLRVIGAAAGLGIPVLAYGSHVDDEALAGARAAGAAKVVPRSMFSARLSELIAEVMA